MAQGFPLTLVETDDRSPRPRANAEDDDEATGEREMDKIHKSSRFGEVLGRGKFKGAETVEVSFVIFSTREDY